MGRNSGREEDNEDLLLEEMEILEKEEAVDLTESFKECKISHMLLFSQTVID